MVLDDGSITYPCGCHGIAGGRPLPARCPIHGPRRIQRQRTRNWKMPINTVYVGRPSMWGNPFIVGRHGTRDHCVELYRKLAAGFLCLSVDRECIEAQRRARKVMEVAHLELRGLDLACWCPSNQPCHADVLLELANSPLPASVAMGAAAQP